MSNALDVIEALLADVTVTESPSGLPVFDVEEVSL